MIIVENKSGLSVCLYQHMGVFSIWECVQTWRRFGRPDPASSSAHEAKPEGM